MSYNFFNLLVAFPGIALSIAAICSSVILKVMESNKHTFSSLPFADNLLFLLSIVIEISFSGDPGPGAHIWMQAANYLQYLALYLFPFCLFLLLNQQYKEYEMKPISPWVLYGIPGLQCLLLSINVYNHMYYRISVDNYYERGDYFLGSQFIAFAGIIVFLFYGGDFYRKTKKQDVLQMLVITSFFVIAAILQILIPGPNWIAAGTSCCTIFLYSYQLRKWSGIFRRKNKELMKKKASLNLSQIDPESFRVSLEAIMNMCKEEPVEASHLVDTFADYMRTSFNEMGKDEWNPFDAERHQLFRYLTIVQARFREEIRVDFETPVRNFTIPPLILQQIFEKAITLTEQDMKACRIILKTEELSPDEKGGILRKNSNTPSGICVEVRIEAENRPDFWEKREITKLFRDVAVRIDAVQDAEFVIEYPGDNVIRCLLTLANKPAAAVNNESVA